MRKRLEDISLLHIVWIYLFIYFAESLQIDSERLWNKEKTNI